MKILHGPNNITSAPRKIASQERLNGFISDSINTTINFLDGPSHFNSKNNIVSKFIFRIKYFFLAIFYYDILNFHAGATLLPKNIDLPFYKFFRKKVIMHYYGSEVRLMKELEKVNKYSNLFSADGKNSPDLDHMKIKRLKFQKKFINYAIAPREYSFYLRKVMPEDMVIEDIWCSNILEEQEKLISKGISYEQKEVPIIMHCPTNKITKGTKYVESAIKNLQAKGIEFEFVLVEDLKHEDLLDFMSKEVDIVLDQFLVGSYANLCFEALALGKLAFCYINDELHRYSCDDYPVVNVTVDELELELEKYILDLDLRSKRAKLGKNFIYKRLDKFQTINKLNKLYLA